MTTTQKIELSRESGACTISSNALAKGDKTVETIGRDRASKIKKEFVAPAALTSASILCCDSSNAMSLKRQAVLAGAYTFCMATTSYISLIHTIQR